MNLDLAGKHILVTGGASGIGWATVQEFLTEGAKVTILDRAPPKEAIARRHAESNDQLHFLQSDITDFEAVKQAEQLAVDHFGPLDGVIHCAAIGSGKFGFPFTNMEPADWGRVLEVDILGMVHVAHAFAPRMQQRQSGAFVFLASVAGQIGSQTDPPYSAAKAANINFAQCMAKDLAKSNVRVNSVCPGMVQTPLNRSVWQAWHDQQPAESRLSYDEWATSKIRSIVPLGRWQTPEDIAAMIVFLTSEKARNITGQTINVDGGFVMHW
ncbi:MAG: SDR family oxidoreductase [Planctomycetota bacterium]|nr:MAG: SDR family oxidoreductase [Planctomycetota bacterium]